MERHTRQDFLKIGGGVLAGLCVSGLAGCGGIRGGQLQDAVDLRASAVKMLRIMTWNIAAPTNDDPLPALAEQIRAQLPDIVLLNECVEWWLGGSQVADLARLAGLRYYKSGWTTQMGPWKGKAVGILSRYPLVDDRLHKLSNPVPTSSYATLEATASIDGVPHRIFSTRLESFTHSRDEVNNKAHLKQSIAMLRSVDRGVPVIFGGDINVPTWHSQFVDFEKNGGLARASFERPDPSVCSIVNPSEGVIDHVFYRGPYTVTQMEVGCPRPEDHPSDHPWVLVELSKVNSSTLMGYRSLRSSRNYPPPYPRRYLRHQESFGELTEIRSRRDRRQATFKVVPGLADGRYVSFEAASRPNHFLRHQDSRDCVIDVG